MNGTTARRSPGRKGTPQAEPTSKLPHTAAEVLRRHVVLEVESIDRMYLNVIVRRLQILEGALRFLRQQRKARILSTSVLEPMTRAFVRAVEQFVARERIPLVNFEKDQRKEEIAERMRSAFSGREGVVFVGKAQEKCTVYRTLKRHNPRDNSCYPWVVKSTAMVNHYYFYCVDEDFGPFFLKFCSYFPYNAKLCLNGHEYAKRQLEGENIGYQALDNGIQSCANPRRLQAICDSLSADKIEALLRKWLRRLPHPFPAADRRAGYQYELSILQIELSLTQVLDRPLSGRILFEDIIRENLDLGRPRQVQLIFDRRINKTTPGTFRSRVITEGVIPSLHIDYKSARLKQYHKQGRALRTETTINNPNDFYLGKSLCNLPALRAIGFQANRRLLQLENITHDCILAEETVQQLNRPLLVDQQRASALRFADATVQALCNALLSFELLPAGFCSRDLRNNVAALLGCDVEQLTQARMTYQLRRLRLHGVIERIPRSHRYRLTTFGLRVAVFYTRTYARILRPGLGLALPVSCRVPSRLMRCFDQLEQEVHAWTDRARLAA